MDCVQQNPITAFLLITPNVGSGSFGTVVFRTLDSFTVVWLDGYPIPFFIYLSPSCQAFYASGGICKSCSKKCHEKTTWFSNCNLKKKTNKKTNQNNQQTHSKAFACMIFTLWHCNNVCLYLSKLLPKCNHFQSMDKSCPQRTTSTDVCALPCSNIRHKARLARTWPKLLLISPAVDHCLFMELFPNNWKIRDLFNSSSNVCRSMIQPKAILAGLQDSFLFPLYLNLSFSIFSSKYLKRPWCRWFPCHLATARKWLCFFSHQTNNLLHFTWKQSWFGCWVFFNQNLSFLFVEEGLYIPPADTP